ncbi:MAG: phosphomannomutase/phosphoglucomutase, partial [Planctomycetes bacterium]|nr:phosphomannomutase/phosphoglucomutase [Planctomycetota bacterium]
MSIYKAYDIRGIVPDELNDHLAEKIGIGFANFMQEEAGKEDRNIVTANCMRGSGKGLLSSLHAGMLKAGANIIHIGLSSTPMFYFAAGFLGVDGGIACTASHNPSQYNGFKMVRAGNRPVSEDSGIREIEKRVADLKFRFGQEQGDIRYSKIFSEYEQKLLGFAKNTDKKLRVAADAANGMAGTYKPILDKLGFELTSMFFEPDGTFPNHEANPLKIENLSAIQAVMLGKQYDFGVAFDGDADRAMFLDESGQVVPADIMTALISQTVLKEHAGSAIVYDVRSSRIVPELVKNLGGTPVRDKVGHSFIKETM